MTATRIRLMLADMDGTLVTGVKGLTGRAIQAVRRLRDAGIRFSVTGGRPPADPQVKHAARHVTDSNDEDGFAKAMERCVLADVTATRS